MIEKKKKIIIYTLFLLILSWNIGIFSEFLIYQFPFLIKLLPFLKYNYSLVCHTESDKLLCSGMHHTLTCSRCTGIYLGGLFSSLITLFGYNKNFSTRLLLFSSLPMITDVLLLTIGLYNYSHLIALLTGLLLGSVGFFYIQNLIMDLLLNFRKIK